ERIGEDDGVEARKRAPHADGGCGARRGARDRRVGSDPAPAPDGIRHPGGGALPAPDDRPERRPRAGAGGLARRAHRRPRAGAPRAGRAARGGVRRALPESALGRPAAARGRGARARGRPPAPPPRRALRRARPDHADRAAARVPRTPGAAPEDRDLRDARHARGGARGGPDRAPGRRAAAGGRHAGGARLEPGPRGAGVPRGGGGVSPDLLREVAAETGRHVVLVAVSIGIATAIGVPLGVFLTPRPAWGRPVLALVGRLHTIPTLPPFGFLIPVAPLRCAV